MISVCSALIRKLPESLVGSVRLERFGDRYKNNVSKGLFERKSSNATIFIL
jgi:hypothetical protein